MCFTNKLSVEVLDFVRNKAKADYYKVEKIPATIVEGEEDYGIRFYEIPGGDTNSHRSFMP